MYIHICIYICIYICIHSYDYIYFPPLCLGRRDRKLLPDNLFVFSNLCVNVVIVKLRLLVKATYPYSELFCALLSRQSPLVFQLGGCLCGCCCCVGRGVLVGLLLLSKSVCERLKDWKPVISPTKCRIPRRQQ